MEDELNYQLKKVNAEFELLRRENGMYEEKLVEMDRDRQQMYLVMFRKGQQAANQEVGLISSHQSRKINFIPSK